MKLKLVSAIAIILGVVLATGGCGSNSDEIAVNNDDFTIIHSDDDVTMEDNFQYESSTVEFAYNPLAGARLDLSDDPLIAKYISLWPELIQIDEELGTVWEIVFHEDDLEAASHIVASTDDAIDFLNAHARIFGLELPANADNFGLRYGYDENTGVMVYLFEPNFGGILNPGYIEMWVRGATNEVWLMYSDFNFRLHGLDLMPSIPGPGALFIAQRWMEARGAELWEDSVELMVALNEHRDPVLTWFTVGVSESSTFRVGILANGPNAGTVWRYSILAN